MNLLETQNISLFPSFSDNFYLIIGLGIGIPVFFLTILIVAILFIYARKVRKRQQRHTSEEPDR